MQMLITQNKHGTCRKSAENGLLKSLTPEPGEASACKIKILKCQNVDQTWLLPLDIDTCAYHQHVHDEDMITQTYSGMPG